MSPVEVMPELKQIIGAMLFVSKEPLKVSHIRKVLNEVAAKKGGGAKDFAKAGDKQIKEAVESLIADLNQTAVGLNIVEVANGYRLENDASCGPWLMEMLNRGRPQRLSRPALETLAIIAYRQPCARGEIEAVRGVAVDQIVRNLLDMQLVRVVGKSDLPGRPWLFGTTQRFLEHFGLNRVDDLPGVEELKRMGAQQVKKATRRKSEPEDEQAGSSGPAALQEPERPADEG